MLLCLLAVVIGIATAEIRGADPAKLDLYKGSQFVCADGTQSFPSDVVNDDYCDCKDGSDEPGTAACSNGVFYCKNKLFKGQLIRSSRVDDTICDCCYGSDEASGRCPNNCRELGSQMYAEAQRLRREQAMGFQQRLVYIADGKAAKQRRDNDISVFTEEKDKLQADMDARKQHMADVEEPAKEAKERAAEAHKAAEEAQKAAASETHRVAAEGVYMGMDTDGDGDVSSDELLVYGASETALLQYEDIQTMVDSGELDPAMVLQKLQEQMVVDAEDKEREEAAEKRREGKRAKKPALRDPPPPPIMDEVEQEDGEELWGEDGKKIQKQKDLADDSSEGDFSEDHYDEDHYDDYSDPEEDEEQEEDEEEAVSPVRNTLVYDPETQQLVDVYEDAKNLYEESKSRYENVKRQLDELVTLDTTDFGEGEEFFKLKGECFDTKMDGYTYKLCPFEKSEQDRTNIGKWDRWEADEDGVNRYKTMIYDKGNSCWQGPNRSTKVNLVCGSENKFLKAFEPAKCEYEYVFATPALCDKIQQEEVIHEEL